MKTTILIDQKLSRRKFLYTSLTLLASASMQPLLSSCSKSKDKPPKARNLGLNLKPDENGILLPPGFKSRIVARSSQAPVKNNSFKWHSAPDGGSVFDTDDGGWIYVSNCEMNNKKGGVNGLRFNSKGMAVDCYPILTATNRNCGGGVTPRNTWLSCEEIENGTVWECDPTGIKPSVQLPSLGVFSHEFIVFDPLKGQLYLTEDHFEGCFYRFTPDSLTSDGYPDFSKGTLEAAQVIDGQQGKVLWHKISDPEAKSLPTRKQIPQSTKFKGGEGVCIRDNIVYLTTKKDNIIWAYSTKDQTISIYYDDDNHLPHPELTGLDTIITSPKGDLVIAEDGGDMQIISIDKNKNIKPLLQVLNQQDSEITGLAFDSSGSRLYFSSQRGESGISSDGITYEITGPFKEY